jgi:phospholipid/cholesterol/gamma-HCH transport system substrate-binding protein
MKKQRNEIVVGAFVVIGVLLLSIMVFFVSGVYLFRSGYPVTVLYNYVDILDKGAPVRMAGVRVGEVSSVELYFDEKEKRTRVKVKLFIESTADIRENYAFEIRGTHILSEPHIEISPRPGDSPKIRKDQVLEGEKLVPMEHLIRRAQNIAENLDEIVASIHGTMQDKETAEAMKKLVVNISKLSASMEKLVSGSDEDFQKTLENIRTSSDSIRQIMEGMERGEGTVGSLLVKDELYKEMEAFMADIRKHPWKLLKKDKKFFFF